MDNFAPNSLLIVFRLSDVRARARPALILYFKLNTGCQDRLLCKNGNAHAASHSVSSTIFRCILSIEMCYSVL